MISKYSEVVLEEIDKFIDGEDAIAVFDLPIEYPEIEGNITPIFTTYIDPFLIFILKIEPDEGKISYISLYTSDNGVFSHRSDETNDFKKLMIQTDEGWTKFE
jgi:hypothetical protein